MTAGPSALASALSAAGFVAAEEEAAELIDAAGGDQARLEAMTGRRLRGEPLAWITGTAQFCGLAVRVDPGVYVPRWQSEPLARRALARLPPSGAAVDLCTGSGAVAAVLARGRPRARVVASEIDPVAAACAAANGVDVRLGDLFAPIPVDLVGRVDVVVGVVPYVPGPALTLLPRDTLVFEQPLAYDGGADGTEILRRAVAGAARFLGPGGALVLELGADQDDALSADLEAHGFTDVAVVVDGDGDVRGIEATARGR